MAFFWLPYSHESFLQIAIKKKGADPDLKTLGVPTHCEDERTRQKQAEKERQMAERTEGLETVEKDRMELRDCENLRPKQKKDLEIGRTELKGTSTSGSTNDAVRFRQTYPAQHER